MHSDYLVDEDLRKEYRGFVMEKNREYGLWKITTQPTGKRCPNVLQGLWTGTELLRSKIDHYLALKEREANATNNNQN
jgi:hypothetical protein